MGKIKQKLIVWIIGSNASGKTTQSKLLHKYYGTDEKKLHDVVFEGEKIRSTSFGTTIGHVGLVKDNQCTGTDTINTKESLRLSTGITIAKCDIAVVDGIMATFQWSEILNGYKDVKTFVILLDFPDLESNLVRVLNRRVKKHIAKNPNDEEFEMEIYESFIEELEERTVKNMNSKIKNFRSLYNKASQTCNFSCIINASLTEEEIHVKIIQELEAVIK